VLLGIYGHTGAVAGFLFLPGGLPLFCCICSVVRVDFRFSAPCLLRCSLRALLRYAPDTLYTPPCGCYFARDYPAAGHLTVQTFSGSCLDGTRITTVAFVGLTVSLTVASLVAPRVHLPVYRTAHGIYVC